MTREEQNKEQKEGYALAIRYLNNAKETLKKAGKEGRRFKDTKYVSSASGIAYRGVLVALDIWLKLKCANLPKSDKHGRKKGVSVDFYRKNLMNRDKKLLDDYNDVYDSLHLLGYYDCIRSVATIEDGFKLAEEIIERIRPEVQNA
ncbi:MAG: DUF5618 family protein [Fibromonadales bacterium]|nr:DUF5618 family protein [Fibromonadales bacterium]